MATAESLSSSVFLLKHLNKLEQDYQPLWWAGIAALLFSVAENIQTSSNRVNAAWYYVLNIVAVICHGLALVALVLSANTPANMHRTLLIVVSSLFAFLRVLGTNLPRFYPRPNVLTISALLSFMSNGVYAYLIYLFSTAGRYAPFNIAMQLTGYLAAILHFAVIGKDLYHVRRIVMHRHRDTPQGKPDMEIEEFVQTVMDGPLRSAVYGLFTLSMFLSAFNTHTYCPSGE